MKNVPGHNGRVGMYGISYPGFYCSAGMIDAHPALKAVSPQAPVGDWYFDDFLHNGAFFLAHAYPLAGQQRRRPAASRPPTSRQPVEYPTPDGYKLFLEAGTWRASTSSSQGRRAVLERDDGSTPTATSSGRSGRSCRT